MNLVMVLPLYRGGKVNAEPADRPPIRAMLMNVNTQFGNAKLVADALVKHAPDVLVLEEVDKRWLSDLAPALAAYPHSRTAPRSDNFGIALFMVPIDHCLHSPGIAVVNRETGPAVGSDHYPVIVDFLIRRPDSADLTGTAHSATLLSF